MNDAGTQPDRPDESSVFRRKMVMATLLCNVVVYALVGLTMWQSLLHAEKQAEITTQNLSCTLALHIGGILDKADLAILSLADEVQRKLAGGGITTPGYPLYVNVGQSTGEILAGWRMDALAYLLLAALFTIGSTASARMLFLRWRRVKEVEDELRRSNEELEERVRKRTAELLDAGQRLQLELAERSQVEQELKENEELFKQFVEHSPIYTFIKDENLRVVQISKNFEQMLDRPVERIFGRNMEELFPPEFAAKIVQDDLRVLESGEIFHGNEEFGGRSYTTVKFAIRLGNKKYLAGYTIDITERKKAEEERLLFERKLQQTQKLESLGILAGGIAHDFNNILMAIIGNADFARMKIDGDSPIAANLSNIIKAANRAADLARQMLAYSGKGKFIIKSVSLDRLVEEMGQILHASISKKARLRFNFAPDLPPVEADPAQVQQLIMNLVINASEAIEANNGDIVITTGCIHCDKACLKETGLTEDLTEGWYVFLEVADTGCGMNRETMARIFDPFFTTKYTGRGLGMAAVQGIVRGHHGAIRVRSEPDRGSTFTVYLPASHGPVEVSKGEKEPLPYWHGSGTVLLIDDEECILSTCGELLEALGFKVITARNGSEGLRMYVESAEKIACVILDLAMPEMDGEQCFQELRRINPEVRVIMSSGYGEQEISPAIVEKMVAGFIQKPYNFSDLRRILQSVFERA